MARFPLAAAAAAAIASVLPGALARANTADNVTATTANSDLTVAGSYSGGIPGTTSDVVFTLGTAYSGTFTGNTTTLSIGTLNDLNATSLTVNGNKSFTLNGTANSIAPSAGDLIYVAGSSTLTLNNTGGLALASSGNFDVAGSATISAAITGTGGITKTGAGSLSLSGNNSGYTSGITISGGTLSFAADNNLGTSASGVTLSGGTLAAAGLGSSIANTHVITIGANGGTLQMAQGNGSEWQFNTGNTLTGSGNLTINGTGALGQAGVNASALSLTAANNYSGNVTIQNGAIVGLKDPNGLGTTSTITVGNNGLLSTNTTFSRSFAINSGGVLGWDGNSGNYAGTITLNGAATVRMQDWYGSTTRSGTISGNITGTGGLTVNSGNGSNGNLTLTATNNNWTGGLALNSTNLTFAPSSGSASQTIAGGNVTLNGGTLYSNDGTLILGNTTDTITVSSATTLQKQWGYWNDQPSGNGPSKALALNGILHGSATLTLQGILGGTNEGSAISINNANNDYNGTINVTGNSGNVGFALIDGANNALQYASINASGNGSKIPFALQFASGVTAPVLGSLNGSSNIKLQDNSTTTGGLNNHGATPAGAPVALTVGGNNGNTTYTGILSGNGSLTKNGTGAWTLSGPSSFTGITTISSGTLALAPASGTNNIASSKSITVGAGATFSIANVGGTGANAFALNGTGNQSTSQILGGVGTVTGAVKIASGGTLSAGTNSGTGTIGASTVPATGTTNTIGKLTVGTVGTGNVTLGAGGNLVIKASDVIAANGGAGVAGTNYDTISSPGAINVASPQASPFTIELLSYGTLASPTANTAVANFSTTGSYTWQIASFTSSNIPGTSSAGTTILTSGTYHTAAVADAGLFALDTSNFRTANTGTLSGSFYLEAISDGTGAGSLDVVYDATPEPGTTLLMLTGAADGERPPPAAQRTSRDIGLADFPCGTGRINPRPNCIVRVEARCAATSASSNPPIRPVLACLSENSLRRDVVPVELIDGADPLVGEKLLAAEGGMNSVPDPVICRGAVAGIFVDLLQFDERCVVLRCEIRDDLLPLEQFRVVSPQFSFFLPLGKPNGSHNTRRTCGNDFTVSPSNCSYRCW